METAAAGMTMDAVTDRISGLIEPSLAAMGYALVRVQLSGTKRPKLQIMAERQDDGGMTVEDCADISRTVSALLDVEDPLPGEYVLEVSSPGIDRPLTRIEDYSRFAGLEAKVELRLPQDGRRRFTGRLDGVENGAVKLETDRGPVALPFADIQKAKLLMTDELLALAAREQSGRHAAQGAGQPKKAEKK